MRRLTRVTVSLLLAIIYLLIMVSPLATLFPHSAEILLPVDGECSGDCSLCGCSPERSINRTCCCWQKRLLLCDLPDRVMGANCCGKPSRFADHVVYCGIPPCGNGRDIPFSDERKFDCLLISGCANLTYPHLETPVPASPLHLIGRNADPPDPPPKLLFLS